jgi:hypothetical protein
VFDEKNRVIQDNNLVQKQNASYTFSMPETESTIQSNSYCNET